MSESTARTETIGAPAWRYVVLFAFGAVVISFFDGFHTHSGTTRYASVIAWQAAWWTPVIFGASVGVGGPLYAYGYPRLGGDRAPPPWSALFPAFLAFGCMYYASGYLPASNIVKLAVLIVAGVVFWRWLDRTRAGIILAILTAITGPVTEIILVHAGAFEHLQPDVLGIPIWLPGLYAASAPVIGQGARKFLGAR